MKTRISVVVLCVMIGIGFSACGGSKKAPKGMKESFNPFPGFKPDKSTLRAVGFGESIDRNVAEQLALTNAQSKMAASIQTVFNQVNTNYFNQRAENRDKELEQKMEGMSRSVVSQVLSNMNFVDSKTYEPENKKANNQAFQCYTAVEMPKDEIGKQIMRGISDATRNRIDFDQKQYEKIFNEELENYTKMP